MPFVEQVPLVLSNSIQTELTFTPPSSGFYLYAGGLGGSTTAMATVTFSHDVEVVSGFEDAVIVVFERDDYEICFINGNQ